MKQLLLIDGNAILHRAYHALPPLTNNKGEVVNAVYGFFSMLFYVINQVKPEYIIVCFDRPKPTFRQTLYAGYQQHRPKMADDLVPQIDKLHDILHKMKVTVFEVDGYEADDLIGTLAFQAVAYDKETEVIIISGDRDLLQLVNRRVKMLAPVTGITNTILYDGAKVEEKFGIKPGQVVDYKALVGDPSDGYPGVAGIGPKTASELLKKYKTLEGIYEKIGNINPRISDKLAKDCEQASLCKKLATVVQDVPVRLKLDECVLEKLDVEGLRTAFKEQGFKTLTNRIDNVFKTQKQVKIKEEKNEQLGLL